MHTEGRESRVSRPVALESPRPCERTDRQNSIGSLFVRIAAVAAAMLAIALTPTQAQAAVGPGSGTGNIRFYIGLSRGGLIKDNENDLRAFAVIQEHVNTIKKQLSDDAQTGDLEFWESKNWMKLRALPITHYLIAHPKKRKSSVIEVEWHFGKFPANDFSANREPEYAGLLKQRTIITITGSDAAPTIAQQEENTLIPYNYASDSAVSIVTRLNRILPETRKVHEYFVDCFKNYIPDSQDVHRWMMVELSNELERGAGGVLHPIWKLDSVEMAFTMCSEPRYRDLNTYSYKDAHLYVGGSIWLYGQGATEDHD
jgi:hypothetical protein